MNFAEHRFVLGTIDEMRRCGSWAGKTHVQKTISLMDSRAKIHVPFEFVLYKHGPYSFELQDTLESMLSYAAVKKIPVASYGPQLSPGENASFLREMEGISPEVQNEIKRVAEFVGKRTILELERLATAGWIISKEGLRDNAVVASRLHALKPHIPMSDALDACRQVSELFP